MRGLAVFALLLAVSHAAEIHISASCGDAHDIDRGVIRGAGNNWRFEPTTVSPSLVNCLAAAASSSQLVTVHALMRSGSSERLSTASIPLVCRARCLRLGSNASGQCALKAANFEEEFTVHLDEDGKPFHVSYLASSSGCDTVRYLMCGNVLANVAQSAVSADSVHFSTKVAARRTSEGPVYALLLIVYSIFLTHYAAKVLPRWRVALAAQTASRKRRPTRPFTCHRYENYLESYSFANCVSHKTFLLGVVFVVFVMPMLTGAPPEGGAQGAGGAAAAAPARR